MRTFKLLGVAALALSTAACVESVDGNMGYSDGYYAPSQASYGQTGYYAQPAYYAPTYYAPTQVVTQTRYVPVPVAVPQRTFTPQAPSRTANNGHEHDRPQANNTPATPQQPHQPSPGNNQHHGNSNGGGNNNSHDRDNDGRPDRRS